MDYDGYVIFRSGGTRVNTVPFKTFEEVVAEAKKRADECIRQDLEQTFVIYRGCAVIRARKIRPVFEVEVEKFTTCT